MSILLVDSYDSFTFNLESLLKKATNKNIYTIHNDTLANFADLDQFLPLFDAIVLGPGPGNPNLSSDVGILPYLINKSEPIPILGICLGFQSLCLETGNEVLGLEDIKHGQIYDMKFLQHDQLFVGVEEGFKSVRYHSLHVNLTNDQIIPLAYCQEPNDDSKIIMAGKHRSRPHYGVQYHPESICSEQGESLIRNFMQIAEQYNNGNRIIIKNCDLVKALVSKTIHPQPLIDEFATQSKNTLIIEQFNSSSTPLEICDYLHCQQEDFYLLNSASKPGNWTIIGLPIPLRTDVISHSTELADKVTVSKFNSDDKKQITLSKDSTIWNYIADYTKERYIERPVDCDLPFLGGLVGFFSYEEGEFIQLEKLERMTNEPIPDTKLIFIERCILYNIERKQYSIVSILPKDEEWVNDQIALFSSLNHKIGDIPASIKELGDIKIELPNKSEYSDQFERCQSYLKSGDSYELCLTTPTKIRIPSNVEPWMIYKILTLKNPSPYSSYMKFDDSILISSSPERFLSWKHNDKVQLRPIKGTVKRTKETTFESAEKLLKIPKEMGENLMIVDLIRHDLYNLLDEVQVPKLMQVEEYETVYQLVSVIEGKLSNKVSGIDVLNRSLPPGSMTGAPKKRSIELLHSLEKFKRRGIYSGVSGYWSVTDDGDWSVIIRSIFNYSEDVDNTENDQIWRIGAGGAITVLSECESEWEEMELKLVSALQAFT